MAYCIMILKQLVMPTYPIIKYRRFVRFALKKFGNMTALQNFKINNR
jgi:hypothetical protein